MSYQQKIAYVLIGPSAAGKSSVSKVIKEKYGDKCITFSLDECRLKYFSQNVPKAIGDIKGIYHQAHDYCSENNASFKAFAHDEWEACFGHPVIIVDNVNGTRKSRQQWVEKLRKEKYKIVMVEFLTPLQVVIDRQNTRPDKKVPVPIVKQQFFGQESAMVGSECDAVIFHDGVSEFKF